MFLCLPGPDPLVRGTMDTDPGSGPDRDPAMKIAKIVEKH